MQIYTIFVGGFSRTQFH